MKQRMIPHGPVIYKAGAEYVVRHYANPYMYRTKRGVILVCLWVRWPSYDFLFGVPSRGHKDFGKEVGFFQFRDTRAKRVQAGFYVDAEELRCLIDGFRLIKKVDKARKDAQKRRDGQ